MYLRRKINTSWLKAARPRIFPTRVGEFRGTKLNLVCTKNLNLV
jgi:hypothetical protein